MALEQQAEFLAKIPPFDLLQDKALQHMASSMDVVYFPVDSFIPVSASQSNTQNYLYFVIKGLVTEHLDETLLGHYSARGFFGERELLQKNKEVGKTKFSVLEEAILYRLPGVLFLEAFDNNAAIQNYFNASIVDKLNHLHQTVQATSSTEIMMDSVCSAPIQALVEVEEQQTLQQAVAKMVENKSDACIVLNQKSQSPLGIVTSTDVMKFIAKQDSTELTRPGVLTELANSPLQTVHQFDFLFNALLKMTRFQIDRLVVRADEGFVGFLHLKDLMSLFANQSGLVLLKVEQAQNVQDLNTLGNQVDSLIGSLNRKGIKTHYIAKLVNELHRKMIQKLVMFLLPENLKDSVNVLVMGSEGRAEQVLRTDQDNALIYSNDLNETEERELAEFSVRFTDAMIEIGFPRCPGDVMLSNPIWRQSESGFKSQLSDWFNQPNLENFMSIAIFYDAESVSGDEKMMLSVKARLAAKIRENPVFLRHFALPAIQFATPVSFFGNLLTEQDKGVKKIDLKKGGIFPIVHGVRCYALEQGMTETNTHWRIKALMDKGVFEESFGIELGETLNYLNTLRLESMLQQKESKLVENPDNYIKVHDLSHLQQDLLKQSFQVVDEFKKRLTYHFKLREVM